MTSRASNMWRVGKPDWNVDIEITKDGDFRAWRMKSNCANFLLDRRSNRSSWLVELGEWYRVQMYFEMLGRKIFIQMSWKTRFMKSN